MREILFKAKRIDNGRWETGYYVKKIKWHRLSDRKYVKEEKHYICVNMVSSEDSYIDRIEVNPETICQYTGLTDKNGNKIWENDCIGHRLNVVEFLNGTWCVSGDRQLFFYAKKHGIIGNIFDNDDLIGE